MTTQPPPGTPQPLDGETVTALERIEQLAGVARSHRTGKEPDLHIDCEHIGCIAARELDRIRSRALALETPLPGAAMATGCPFWADGKHAMVAVGWRPRTKSCECGAFVTSRIPREPPPLRSVEDFD